MAKLLTEEEYNALLADAERYRWLRDGKRLDYYGARGIYACEAQTDDYYAPDGIYGDELDKAIDKAREK